MLKAGEERRHHPGVVKELDQVSRMRVRDKQSQQHSLLGASHGPSIWQVINAYSYPRTTSQDTFPSPHRLLVRLLSALRGWRVKPWSYLLKGFRDDGLSLTRWGPPSEVPSERIPHQATLVCYGPAKPPSRVGAWDICWVDPWGLLVIQHFKRKQSTANGCQALSESVGHLRLCSNSQEVDNRVV